MRFLSLLPLALLTVLLVSSGTLTGASPRLSPSALPRWDAGVRGGVPAVETRFSLTAEALADGAATAIQAAIDTVPTPGAVQLPAGTFLIHHPIRLRSGVVLRGSGRRATELVFHLESLDEPTGVRPAMGGVQFAGKRLRREYPIASGAEIGSQRLRMESTHAFSVGELILVFSENDPALMYTDPRWNRDWARQSIAQIVTVTAIEGETLVIDTPLRLDYRQDLQPRVQRLRPIENAGLENLHLRRTDDLPDNIVGLESALNCWVVDTETEMTGRGHIWINFSRFITVAGNESHHATSYGGGGNGYGIVAGNVAVDCLIENNRLHALRHALMTKRGSNGNVFAYNYSFDRRREEPGRPLLCDISVHGHYSYQNLFEGNVVEFVELADYWGPTGPHTTFFRNHVATRIEINDHSHGTVIWGNVIAGEGVQSDGTSKNFRIEANVAAPDPTAAGSKNLPDSLFRSERPSYWDAHLPWPPIGPDVPPGDGPRIPAEQEPD